jgi:hypothetical protein
MCRGLALGWNFSNGIVCKGVSSHTDTLDNLEDKFLKLELIIDDSKEDGYSLELNENYSKDKLIPFKECLNKKGELKKEVYKIIIQEIMKDENKYLRWLLKNRSYAKSKGDCDNSYQEVGRNCYNSSQKVGGDCYNSSQKVGGDYYNSYQKVGGEIYINNIINYDNEVDTFIKKLSDEHIKLSWKMLVRLAIKGYEVDKEIKK